jgi:hypothetical protein
MYVNSELCVLPSTHASEYTYLEVHTEYKLCSMYFGVHASEYILCTTHTLEYMLQSPHPSMYVLRGYTYFRAHTPEYVLQGYTCFGAHTPEYVTEISSSILHLRKKESTYTGAHIQTPAHLSKKTPNRCQLAHEHRKNL